MRVVLAQPRGFWSVLTRPDGAKQWAYQGYAMWTYDGDKKPGDMHGNDTFQYAFADSPDVATDAAKKQAAEAVQLAKKFAKGR